MLEKIRWVLGGLHGAVVRPGMKRSTLQFRLRKLELVRPGTWRLPPLPRRHPSGSAHIWAGCQPAGSVAWGRARCVAAMSPPTRATAPVLPTWPKSTAGSLHLA
jgi:hypothetical protein